VTYYFLRDTWQISQGLWELTENYANSASMILFLGEAFGVFGAREAYKEAMSHAITLMENQTRINPYPMTVMSGEVQHNLEIKRAIVGFVTTRATSTTSMSDCYNEYPRKAL